MKKLFLLLVLFISCNGHNFKQTRLSPERINKLIDSFEEDIRQENVNNELIRNIDFLNSYNCKTQDDIYHDADIINDALENLNAKFYQLNNELRKILAQKINGSINSANIYIKRLFLDLIANLKIKIKPFIKTYMQPALIPVATSMPSLIDQFANELVKLKEFVLRKHEDIEIQANYTFGRFNLDEIVQNINLDLDIKNEILKDLKAIYDADIADYNIMLSVKDKAKQFFEKLFPDLKIDDVIVL